MYCLRNSTFSRNLLHIHSLDKYLLNSGEDARRDRHGPSSHGAGYFCGWGMVILVIFVIGDELILCSKQIETSVDGVEEGWVSQAACGGCLGLVSPLGSVPCLGLTQITWNSGSPCHN